MTAVLVKALARCVLPALSVIVASCEDNEVDRPSAGQSQPPSAPRAASQHGVPPATRAPPLRSPHAGRTTTLVAERAAVDGPPPGGAETPSLLVSARRSWEQPLTECDGVHVYIVSYSASYPERSVASLSTTADARARVVRQGQWIGEWEVLAITDDWTGMRPWVWLRRGTEVCRAQLTGNPKRVPPPEREPRRRKARRKARR